MSIYPYNVDKHDDTSSGGCGSEEPAMSSYEMFLASFSSSILGVNSFAIAEPVRPWGGIGFNEAPNYRSDEHSYTRK